MPRPRRAAEGGLIYHALNRATARLAIFDSDDDYAAFERVLAQAVARHDMRLLAYCLMPNHFHLLLWPREDGAIALCWVTWTSGARVISATLEPATRRPEHGPSPILTQEIRACPILPRPRS